MGEVGTKGEGTGNPHIGDREKSATETARKATVGMSMEETVSS